MSSTSTTSASIAEDKESSNDGPVKDELEAKLSPLPLTDIPDFCKDAKVSPIADSPLTEADFCEEKESPTTELESAKLGPSSAKVGPAIAEETKLGPLLNNNHVQNQKLEGVKNSSTKLCSNNGPTPVGPVGVVDKAGPAEIKTMVGPKMCSETKSNKNTATKIETEEKEAKLGPNIDATRLSPPSESKVEDAKVGPKEETKPLNNNNDNAAFNHPRSVVTTVVVQTLPSPSGCSETSDYQRSTPSPRDEKDSGIASLEDWSLPSSGNPTPASNAAEESDPGFAEIEINQLPASSAQAKSSIPKAENVLPCPKQQQKQQPPLAVHYQHHVQKRHNLNIEDQQRLRRCSLRSLSSSSSTTSSEISSSSSSKDLKDPQVSVSAANIVLQNVRVALEKLPISPAAAASKRRFSVEAEIIKDCSSTSVKKARITDYMQETKKRRREFITNRRKEKLDKFLNLSSEENFDHFEKIEENFVKTENNFTTAAKKDVEYFSFVAPSPPVQQSSTNMQISSETSSTETELSSTSTSSVASLICKWEDCLHSEPFASVTSLLDHLKCVHADSQIPSPSKTTENFQYKCHWRGCKVQGKGSSSRSWLEKHLVTNHGGKRPFECIFEGCRMRFGTRALLERHVNVHLTSNGSKTGGLESSSETSESSSSSNSHQNSRQILRLRSRSDKLRKWFTRRPSTLSKAFDAFDLKVMSEINSRLSSTFKSRGFVIPDPKKTDLKFSGRILAIRSESESGDSGAKIKTRKKSNSTNSSEAAAASASFLVRWSEDDAGGSILPDSWISAGGEDIIEDGSLEKTVPWTALTPDERSELLRVNGGSIQSSRHPWKKNGSLVGSSKRKQRSHKSSMDNVKQEIRVLD